jgi:tripartite-type tricarboxylate transporter receptor subunit TctC
MISAASRAVLSALALFAATFGAGAQDFPTRPITIVLPYPPGASTEQVARMVQPVMQERLKQPVIIENKPGGNGSIGTLAVARAAPDGYTILLTTNALMTIVPHVQTMPFDPLKDFVPLTTAIRGILGIAVNPNVPAKNVAEFIAYAKANPKKVHYGTAGIGSPQHMAGLLLNREANIDLVHVPYKGGAPAANDAMGGHIQAVIATISSVLGQHKSGLLRIIGIGEKERFAGQPDIQAIAETVPGFEATSWLAFYAPAGTPKTAVDVLNRELVYALNTPEVKQKLFDLGLPVVADKPEELDKRTRDDLKLWGEIARAMNVKVE